MDRVDLKNEKNVMDSFINCLSMDCDLTENEDYFRDDTIELGFENESDRIITEYIKKNGIPKTFDAYQDAFNKISDSITGQDYFGNCSTDFIQVGKNKVSVVFAYGGNY